MYLFNQDAICDYNGKSMNGIYNLMTYLSSVHILKFMYENLSYTVFPIDNIYMGIQVSGNYQGVTFWGQLTHINRFVDTFILKQENGNICISTYLMKLL